MRASSIQTSAPGGTTRRSSSSSASWRAIRFSRPSGVTHTVTSRRLAGPGRSSSSACQSECTRARSTCSLARVSTSSASESADMRSRPSKMRSNPAAECESRLEAATLVGTHVVPQRLAVGLHEGHDAFKDQTRGRVLVDLDGPAQRLEGRDVLAGDTREPVHRPQRREVVVRRARRATRETQCEEGHPRQLAQVPLHSIVGRPGSAFGVGFGSSLASGAAGSGAGSGAAPGSSPASSTISGVSGMTMFSFSAKSAWTNDSPIFALLDVDADHPHLDLLAGLEQVLGLASRSSVSSEMCKRPSRSSSSFTKTPKLVILVTLP